MTRRIQVGAVPVGGGAPVSIQSMCNTATEDVEATVQQIRRLEQAGCDIVLMPYDLDEAYAAVAEAVENGTLTEERIDESVLRILTLKYRYGIIE